MAVIIYLLQLTNTAIPTWINNYVNDFLCLPVVLSIITLLFRGLKKNKTYQIPLGVILCLAVYYSFYFEYYLPAKTLRYTSDPIDVFLYFISGLIFYLLNNYGNKSVQ
ncbi:hypothetical protein [Flavobacterium sp.]|uniref:hypothetical protein n=1 Tax=Flavobacterium sp. TaxID=239 RepID=UPI0032668E71